MDLLLYESDTRSGDWSAETLLWKIDSLTIFVGVFVFPGFAAIAPI
jgi:hypothetical protein